jgi:hypothetical protein
MMTEYTTSDLVKFSLDQKPIEFEDAFKSLITDRIASAIDDKKTEMAKTVFSGQEEDTADAEAA